MMLAPNLQPFLAMRSIFPLKPIPKPRLRIDNVDHIAHCLKALFSILGHNPDALGIENIKRGK
jgi:hypothetical protein